MRHHTKDKGDLGVLKAQVDLAIQGYTILVPLTEHAAFDIVAYKDSRFLRIQVKYRSLKQTGHLCVPMKTSWADRNGSHDKPINKTQVDLFCVYCPETDECYYFDPKKYNNTFHLRVNAPANNQVKGIHFAKDFRRVP